MSASVAFCSTSKHADAALAVDLGDGVEDVGGDHRRQTERRFVDQHQLRLTHERAADRQHLLLAAGQKSGQQRLAPLQMREQRVDVVAALLQD